MRTLRIAHGHGHYIRRVRGWGLRLRLRQTKSEPVARLNNLHYIALRLDKTGTARGWITFCRLALRLDNLCAVIVIIQIIISLRIKGKRRQCIEPGTASTRNHHSNTTLTYRTERNEQIVHYYTRYMQYIRDNFHIRKKWITFCR